MRPDRRSWPGVLAAGMLLVSACASPIGSSPAATPTTASTSSAPASGAAAGAPPPGSGAGGPGPGAPSGATGPGSTEATAPTGSSTAPAPTTSPAPAPGAVGAFAPYYLRPAASGRIVVDVRSQAGAEPQQATLAHLESVLGQVSGKRIDVLGAGVGGAGRQWTADDLRALADAEGASAGPGDAVLHLLFLAGGYAGDDHVLGISVRSDVAAVFSDRVDQAAGLLADRGRIEDAVTMHEVGHLLGLVDLFLATGRADPDHPGHSRNRGSVMYYAVESTLVASVLGGGPPVDFDADDLADLATIRSG